MASSTSPLLSTSSAYGSTGLAMPIEYKYSEGPPTESMENKPVSLQRDYRWRRIPPQNQGCCDWFMKCDDSKTSVIAGLADQQYGCCAWTGVIPRFLEPGNLEDLGSHGNWKCCFGPLNSMYECCYSHFSQDLVLDRVCGIGACLVNTIYSIICCPCVVCNCSEPRSSENLAYITTMRQVEGASSLDRLFKIMKEADTQQMRDAIVNRKGEFILQQIFTNNTLSLQNTIQAIIFISERQPPFLFYNFPIGEKLHNILALAVTNIQPHAIEILECLLKENDFLRLASSKYLKIVEKQLSSAYCQTKNLKNKQQVRKNLRDNILLLRNYGIVLSNSIAENFYIQKNVFQFFSSQSSWGEHLSKQIAQNIIGDYCMLNK